MKILFLLLVSSRAFAFDTIDPSILDRFKAGTFSLYEISPGYDETADHDIIKDKKKGMKEKEDAGVNLTLRAVPFAPADADAEKVVQVKSCEETVADIRKLKSPGDLPNGDYTFSLGFLELRSKNGLIFDFAKDRFCTGLGDLDSQYYTDTYGYSVSVVSAIGPLVTTSGYISTVKSGAPKSYEGEWKSFDLQTREEAKLADFFDEDTILKSLKKNPYILKQKYSDKLQKDTKLANAIKRINLEGFTVSALDAKGTLAKLHLGLKNVECDTCANTVKQIAMWVKPNPTFMAHLKSVQDKKYGFFLGVKSEKNLNHFQK